jgi:protein translocase SecG subunit
MSEFLTILQVIVSILLALAILTQNRGTGLSATFGGSGDFYVEKRGAEKVLYNSTLVLAALFVGIAIAHIFV